MKYIFFVLNHPAHFHLFKHSIRELRRKGHKCELFAREKDVLIKLLQQGGFSFNTIAASARDKKDILLSSFIDLAKKEIELARHTRRRKPDLMIGTDWAITHVGRIFNIPSLVFNEDDTKATPENRFFYPFAKTLLLPDCCDRGLWLKKRVSYSGYHELAYLHPNRFIPDDELVGKHIGFNKPYIIVRLVKLLASHDVGKKGLGKELLREIVRKAKGYQIYISFEGEPLSGYEKYRYTFDPAIMHHFLANAHAVIGDSQTMIAEAATLGTPAIRFNDFVGRLGYLSELESKYELCYGYRTNQKEQFLSKVSRILEMKDLKRVWKQKTDKMLDDKIDVTAFFVWFIEHYPKSRFIMRDNPDYQYRFRSKNGIGTL